MITHSIDPSLCASLTMSVTACSICALETSAIFEFSSWENLKEAEA